MGDYDIAMILGLRELVAETVNVTVGVEHFHEESMQRLKCLT